MKNIKNIIFSIFLLFILANLDKLVFTSMTTINFWFNTLIPSLFIMLVISNYILENNLIDFSHLKLTYLNKLFNTNSSALLLIFFMILLGSPSSIILINNYVYQNKINKVMAIRLICCTSIISPSYIIGVCGVNLFNSNEMGLFLWLIQILSCLILLILTRTTKIEVNNNISTKKYTIKKALLNSSLSLLLIGGYLMIFLAFFNLVTGYFSENIQLFSAYFFEFSLAIINIDTLNINLLTKSLLLTATLAFSGICMHYQIFSVITEFKLNYLKFLLYKILQTIIATLLIYLIFQLSQMLL